MPERRLTSDDAVRSLLSLINKQARRTPLVITRPSGGAGGGSGGGSTPGMPNPMTDPGDMIYGGTAGAPRSLSIGSEGQVITVFGGEVHWRAAVAAAIVIKLGNASVVAAAAAVDFDSAMFTVSAAPTTEANVSLKSGTVLDALTAVDRDGNFARDRDGELVDGRVRRTVEWS